MPATTIHVGLPGLFSYYRPKKIDIIAAMLGSMIVDIDFFFFLIFRVQIHGIFHTFLGATIVALILSFFISYYQPSVLKLKKLIHWETESNLKSIILGALLGTYSHVIIDGIIYPEMNPFFPFSGNPIFINSFNNTIVKILVWSNTSILTLILILLINKKYNQSQKVQE